MSLRMTLACRQLDSAGRFSGFRPIILRVVEPMPSAPMMRSCWAVVLLVKVIKPVGRSILLHYTYSLVYFMVREAKDLTAWFTNNFTGVPSPSSCSAQSISILFIYCR